MSGMKTVLPGATLGVMGGGQLGRMFVQAAQRLGYFTAVLDVDPTSPAGLVAQYHIATGYLDEQGLAQLMQRCQAITTEFENVPAGALVTLGAYRRVSPSADSVATCQDRASEKACFKRCGVPCAPFALIDSDERLTAAPDALLPGILKTARLGYDGKGQRRVANRAELAAAWDALGRAPCVLEQLLPLALELSVVVARGADGQTVQLPVQQNLHQGGILAVTQVPAPDASADLQQQARPAPPGWPRRSTMSACCAWSSSCWPVISQAWRAAWSPTRWRRGRTTRATGRSTAATAASSTSRCAPSPGCRCRCRASIRRR